MAKFIAILSPDLSGAHAQLATEALKACAMREGYELTVETWNPSSPAAESSAPGAVEADVVLLVGKQTPPAERFKNSKVVAVSVSDLIAHTRQILRDAAGAGAAPVALAAPEKKPAVKLVAITSCPTGIAHTFMAAAALRKAAEDLGYEIKVETQGSVGAKNTLTAD